MKAIVSEKGQITIPKALRDKLGIRPGTSLELDDEHGRVVARLPSEVDIIRKCTVKDTNGHDAGDRVLRHVASILTESFRGEDIVGRWGGDEFIVTIFGARRHSAERRLLSILDRVRVALAAKYGPGNSVILLHYCLICSRYERMYFDAA